MALVGRATASPGPARGAARCAVCSCGSASAGRRGEAAAQWLCRRATQRAQRISDRARGTQFYATHLSFEDLEEPAASSFEFADRGRERVEGVACRKIEARARYASNYDKRLLWVDDDRMVILQIENFREGRLLKRIKALDHRRVQGVWTPGRLQVEDLDKGGRTIVTLEDPSYDVDLPASRFTREALAAGGYD